MGSVILGTTHASLTACNLESRIDEKPPCFAYTAQTKDMAVGFNSDDDYVITRTRMPGGSRMVLDY